MVNDGDVAVIDGDLGGDVLHSNTPLDGMDYNAVGVVTTMKNMENSDGKYSKGVTVKDGSLVISSLVDHKLSLGDKVGSLVEVVIE